MTTKNNVTRFLDSKKVKYQAHALPNEKLGAIAAAEHLGLKPAQMFKTIVFVRPGGGKPILALVDGDSEVDLKAVAAAFKEKKIKLTSQAEAEELTGLQAGGISPLALLNKGFQVVIDSNAEQHSSIVVSAGQRGLMVSLSPKDLVKLTNARLAPISRPLSQ